MGVTAIAEVNGRAYAERYGATREILGRPSAANRKAAKRGKAERDTAVAKMTKKKAAPKRKPAKKVVRKTAKPAVKPAGAKAATEAKKAATEAKEAVKKVKRERRKIADLTKELASASIKAKARKPRAAKPKKARAKLTPRQRAAKAASYIRGKQSKLKRMKPVMYGGRYVSSPVKVTKTLGKRAYVYVSPSGRTRKIPFHGLAGYPSSRAMIDSLGDPSTRDPEEFERVAGLAQRIQKRRKKAAAQMEKHGGIFVPNRKPRRRGSKKTRALTFQEWEKMIANKGKKKAKKKTTKRTTRKAAKKKTTKRTTKKMTAAKRRAAARRRAIGRVVKTVKRSCKTIARKPRKARKHAKRRARKNVTVMQAAANRRRRARRNEPMTQISANKRRRTHRKTRRHTLPPFLMMENPRRARKSRKHVRRSRSLFGMKFRRNAAFSGSFMNHLKQALLFGGAVLSGFLVHRGLTRLVNYKLLKAFEKDAPTVQRNEMLSAAAVAAIGVPLTLKFAPGDAKLAAAGMLASAIHDVLLVLLQKSEKTVPAWKYLSGTGSYYEFAPHQTYTQGVGEYFMSRPGVSGMGEYFQSAGAGSPRQAFAMGAPSGAPMLTQAPAGMGEYIVSDAKGIGDYEEVPPEYTRPVPVDEGIYPDLTAAEKALSIAEAAAGVGAFNTLPTQSTVYPDQYRDNLAAAPDAERAGVFTNGNGIFG